MIQLNTVGPVSVRIGDDVVPAKNELIVAALLFLVAERGKAVPRRAFSDLFFPEADADTSAHSGRQLVYRLRKLGAPLEGDQATIRLAPDAAAWDVEAMLARGTPTDSELAALQRGYLTDAALRQSERFARWLDHHRDDVTVRLRQMLVRQIQNARARKDFRGLDGLARACLALDPLNEEATLAAAESLAAVGSKADALHLLDQYLDDVGSRSRELRVAPKMLRERISAYVNEPEREQIAMVGRSDELATLMSRIEHSAANGSQVCFISGPGGIGKTRLVDEACSIAALSGHAVAHVRLSRHDIERPFAMLRDLGPILLELPGAIGAAPEALAAVRGLCGRGPSQYSRRPSNAYDTRAVAADIQRKVTDLVDAVTEEQPLIIRIEDADRLDDASLELVEELLDGGRRICVLMASRTRIALMDRFAAAATATQIPLSALGPEDSLAVLQHLFLQSSRPVNSTFVENAVRISAGVPLFLHALFRNYLATEDPKALPSTLADSLTARLDQLYDPARSVFDAVVTLGALSTVDRIEEITELPRYSLMQALRALEEQGFLRAGDGVVFPSHDLLADASRRRMPATIKNLLHRTIADSLERQTSVRIDPIAIAFHWEACNENARALQVLITSAGGSTALGQPRQAIALLHRAAALASGAADKNQIDTALLEACDAAGEDTMGLAAAERLGALNGHATLECQILGMEVAARAGKALFPFRSHLEPIAIDRTIHSSLRARAGRLLMMIADDLGDADAGEATLGLLSDIAGISVEVIIPRLIFETVFGKAEGAIELADELRRAIRKSDPVGMRLQGLWTAAIALHRCGEEHRSFEIGLEAYELAKSSAVWSACGAFGALMGELAFCMGDVALSQEWFERTGDAIDISGVTDRASQYFGLGISLALDRNDPKTALALLNDAEKLFPEMLHQRLGLHALAHRVAIEMKLGTSPSDEVLDELLRGHRERQSLGYHDFTANVIVAALREKGRHDDACVVRDEYVGRYRKERSPVAPSFTHLRI